MKNEKILVVEDERIIAIDLQRRLERFGYTVVGIAAAGDQAIELVKEHSPDIILMDIMLVGDIDGIETATIIKNEYAIPVIFLTAYSDEKTLERAKIAEPSGYILKPFKDKELYTTIDISLYKYRVDQQLKREQRWSTAILHSIGDGIIATGTDNKIILLNPIAEKITGWSEDEIIGKYISDIIVLEDMNSESGHSKMMLPSADDAYDRGRPFTFKNCYIENRFGEKLQVEGSLSSITDKTGKSEGIVLALRDTTTVKKLSDAVAYHTSHDKLTGLSNRDIFSIQLEQIIREADTDKEVYSLAYIDVDRFKIVNDTCGHTTADTMLVEIANILKEFSDVTNDSARLGGDQFGLIIRTRTEKEALKRIQQLHSTFHRNKLQWEGKVFAFDTSIGWTRIKSNAENVSEVLAEADDACLIAKEEGGNRIRLFDRKANQFQQRRGEMEWVSKLSKALDENRFELYIQEIRPLSAENNFSKGEILIRMKDEEGNTVMPADFIPAAERYNMMAQIDKWVISKSIELFVENSRNGNHSHIKQFSVNLSAQSMSDESILEHIKGEFAKTGVAPESICFEITETATITNMAAAHDFINELKQTGCSFALDDFGSGFSSFNYLKNLPVDYLKIDGIFVKNMNEDDENRAMVEAINNMGHIMGKKTIAEFVCNATIIEMLTELGVDFAQGYEIATPTPLKAD